MVTVLVPTFNEFEKYAFTGYKEVKIKNTPDWRDINKITAFLPGIPQGGIGKQPLQDLLTQKQKEVRTFYDSRQNTKMLKGYFVTIKEDITDDQHLQQLNSNLAKIPFEQAVETYGFMMNKNRKNHCTLAKLRSAWDSNTLGQLIKHCAPNEFIASKLDFR